MPHAEFAYNKAPSRTTGVSPFKVVYDLDPLGPLDFIPKPMDQKLSADAEQRVAEIQRLHEKVWARIEKSNLEYSVQDNKHRRQRAFQPGDLIWIHLRKERFPTKRKTKLIPRAHDPFKILERINDNAYMVDFPGDYGVSTTFNVTDLSPYLYDNYLENLRANYPSQGENDGGPSLSVITSPIKSKVKLTEVILETLEAAQADIGHTVSRTGVQSTVRQPGCTPCKVPSFVVLLS